MPLVDPPPPPESSAGSSIRAKDLRNLPLILRPTRFDTVPGMDDKPWSFVECDVWVLDRAGVVQGATGVRFSWWKAVEQLRGQIGDYVACRPVEEEGSKTIALIPLADGAKEVAAKAVKVLEDGGDPLTDPF